MFLIEFAKLSTEDVALLAGDKLKKTLPEWERYIWQFVSDWHNPAVSSITVHTSGSTSEPKQIEHTKTAMMNSARMTCRALELKNGENAFLCLPVNKIAGMMMIVRSMIAGMNLYCTKPSTTPLNDLPAALSVAFAAFTPMQLHTGVTNYERFKKAEQVDKIIIGGEAIGAEVLDLIKRLDNRIYSTFGMTETISHIGLKRLNGKKPDAHYRLLEDITIWVDDRNCLVIEAPLLRQPKLITNDLVQLISATEFDWLGRIDNVINSGGVKIFPEALEQQMQAHIESAFFVGSVPDERTGEKLVLALEMKEIKESDMKELKEIFTKLGKLHRPKSVLLFNEFIRTGNGKVKRKETLTQSYKTIELIN